MTALIENKETIVAAATASGRAGVGIIRVSGSDAARIATAVSEHLPAARSASLQTLFDEQGEPIDQGIVLYFPGPNSYTGEDVLELQCHGGPVVMDAIIRSVCAQGARVARAGEFSERAFLNDKMDLAQAEAIADLIDSGSRDAARAAMRSLSGDFSKATEDLTTQVTMLRMHVEAAIDFPEEEIDFLDDAALHDRVDRVRTQFDTLQAKIDNGRALNDGLVVVLAGAPNVGKSSLLNQLLGQDAAIVTEIAGTTRDLIRDTAVIDGLTIEFVDTAGLRTTEDVVEREGIRRSREAVSQADHALILADVSQPDWAAGVETLMSELPESLAVTVVANKIDLIDAKAATTINSPSDAITRIPLSAKTGVGLDALKAHLLSVAGLDRDREGSFSARRRHVVALQNARESFEKGIVQLIEFKAGELMAEELRQCQEHLSSITGRFTSDDLLGKIFGEFCIGK